MKGLSDAPCSSGEYFNRAATCLAMDNAGAVYLGGASIRETPAWSPEHRAIKLRADGYLDWTRAYVDEEDDYGSGAQAMTKDALDRLSLSGYWSTVSYGPDGAQRWTQRLAEPLLELEVRAMASDTAGGTYVLGSVYDSVSSGYDLLLERYDADGLESWSRIFPRPATGLAQGSAMSVLSGDRVVYVGQTPVGVADSTRWRARTKRTATFCSVALSSRRVATPRCGPGRRHAIGPGPHRRRSRQECHGRLRRAGRASRRVRQRGVAPRPRRRRGAGRARRRRGERSRGGSGGQRLRCGPDLERRGLRRVRGEARRRWQRGVAPRDRPRARRRRGVRGGVRRARRRRRARGRCGSRAAPRTATTPMR